MPQDAHIAIERMLEVATSCEEFLDDAEVAHIGHCAECLAEFSALVLGRDGYEGHHDVNE